MIPRVLYSLVALSLTVLAPAAAINIPREDIPAANLEVGDAITPINETEVYVDENEVEWIDLPEEDPETIERRSIFGAPKRCRKLEVRKEWRDLSFINKLAYIGAVKCMMAKDATNKTLPRQITRYDEFVIAHTNSANEVHGVAQFLPWHRHFSYLYHQDLRRCGYLGPFPYWDWTRDTKGNKPLAQSPIFDNILGFGGNGIPGTYQVPTDDDGSDHPLFVETWEGAGCIGSGPFKNTIVHYGPNVRYTNHCIVRGFHEEMRPVFTEASVNNVLSKTTYDEFWNSMDGIPFKPEPRLHDAGHGFMGGDMMSYYTSNNDPIFYPHHASIDRVWWKWQAAHLPTRLYALEGIVQNFPPHGAITDEYSLPFTPFSPNVPVMDVMDPRNEPYCYTY